MKTKEHTKKLHQMNDLCTEKKKLDSRLNTLQNQQVCYFFSDPLSELGKLYKGNYSQDYQVLAFKQILISRPRPAHLGPGGHEVAGTYYIRESEGLALLYAIWVP